MSSCTVRLILVITTLCALPLLSFTVLFSSDFFGTVLAEEDSINLLLDSNIVPQNVEMAARFAMASIHDQIDENDDGHISLQEGSQVNDEQGENQDPIEGIVSDSDGKMTSDEFWEKWTMSPVYNWTVEEMCEWIASDDVLSVYKENFRKLRINGSFMPIFAHKDNVSSPLMNELFKDPKAVKIKSSSRFKAQYKLQHKAWGIVLWGYKPPQDSIWKDVLLAMLFVVAVVGIGYTYRVQRDADDLVKHMRQQMERMQHEYNRMSDQQEDEQWSDSDGGGLQMRHPRDDDGSNSSLESDTVAVVGSSRYQELCTELEDVRNELKDAERRLEEAYDSTWKPPSKLIARLKQTYNVEARYYQERKARSKQNMERSTKQMLKIQSRGGVFSAMRLIHGQADRIDMETQKTIQEMKDIRKEFKDHRDRWAEIETLCGTTLRKSSTTLAAQSHNNVQEQQSHSPRSQRSATAPGQLNLPSSSTPTLVRRSKSTLERSEAVEEVDSGAATDVDSPTNTPPPPKQLRNRSSSNNNMKRLPSSSMIHGATNTNSFEKYKRRSVDDDLPPSSSSSMRQSPSVPQQLTKQHPPALNRPSSAGFMNASLASHQRTQSSVSLPEVGASAYRNGLLSRVRDKNGSPLAPIDAVNSDDASSDTSETPSTASSGRGSKGSRKNKLSKIFSKLVKS